MLARKGIPFERALRTVKTNRIVESAIIARESQVVEVKVINMVASRVRFKIIKK